ncbi:hypothetical protein [Acidiphilium sp. JA12-A1]|uniref:hypothetical protein n=1 Tax=Acidiphilium sp. JA12-A1 TaxID=1464546 RepID=UPI000461B65A|nr:hypothetical protein [Acidiphilium sp. JA12-A1]KDM65913.1 hypothetical protein ACIDI_79c00040 [Acidiphilium sp. JA12-A1]
MDAAAPHPDAAALYPDGAALAARLEAIVAALCDVLAAKGLARGLTGALIVLVWTRLRRLAARFATLLIRPSAPPRCRNFAPRRPAPDTKRPATPRPLPRGRFWLRRALPELAGVTAQLAHLLAEPEMAALLEARPATGRALRPLCHLLGLRPPPSLRLPRPAPPLRPPRPVAVRPQPDPPEAAPVSRPRPPRRRPFRPSRAAAFRA